MKVIIDNAIPFIHGIVEPWAEVVYCSGSDINREVVRDADALIVRTRTQCNKELLEGSTVQFIATATIGRDHIDEAYCKGAGIEVASAAGCNARGVLQWVAAALKQIVIKDGKRPEDYTLGVVGVGNVGSLVVEYARHWGFNVLMCDPPRHEREGGDFLLLDTIAQQTDIITFHTPLDATTHHMLNDRLLATMHPNAVIINASRGGVVDNIAVANSSHRYAFDVWEGEPNINPIVLNNAMLATPHIAGYSRQGKANATSMVINALSHHFSLPLTNWYPADSHPTTPRLISWNELCETIDSYCSIKEETEVLKSSLEAFESLRNNYNYREEYF
ncbi:MAG: 4-phosphoerythronate dehydrogenase [Alistipes sp.]|nr:4-phosphoerythronate dehydrogenase [Alistipes sp.]